MHNKYIKNYNSIISKSCTKKLKQFSIFFCYFLKIKITKNNYQYLSKNNHYKNLIFEHISLNPLPQKIKIKNGESSASNWQNQHRGSWSGGSTSK